MSPRVEEIVGRPPSDFIADPSLLKHPIHHEDRPGVWERQSEADEGVYAYRYQHVDGHWVWLEDHYRFERDEDGRVLLQQGVVFDITARKRAEQARTRALQHERETAQQLRQTVHTHQTFLRSISHELRTPLTSVLGFAQTLEDHDEVLPPAQRQALTSRLAANARRLDQLMGNLLDLERANRHALQLTLHDHVDLAKVCGDVLADVDSASHPLKVEVPKTDLVLDRPKLERIVDNLVRNAIKHTPAGSTVRVRAEMRAEDIVLIVEDDGPGIAPSVVDRLFAPFQQGPQAAADPNPGTGVGLTLVRAFVLAHGGEVWHEPLEPHGARFCVRLPRDARGSTPTTPPALTVPEEPPTREGQEA